MLEVSVLPGSYKLVRVTVKSFCGVNYLSVGQYCEIVRVDNIGETAALEDGDLEEKGIVRNVIEGEIDGVKFCDEYDGCIACNGKIGGDDEVVGECSKCGTMVKRTKCKIFVSARVLVADGNDKVHSLMMFNDIIKSIVSDGGGEWRRSLLAAGPLKFCVDKGGIVYSVEKC